MLHRKRNKKIIMIITIIWMLYWNAISQKLLSIEDDIANWVNCKVALTTRLVLEINDCFWISAASLSICRLLDAANLSLLFCLTLSKKQNYSQIRNGFQIIARGGTSRKNSTLSAVVNDCSRCHIPGFMRCNGRKILSAF